jgi:flagellar hook-length control protein FliK
VRAQLQLDPPNLGRVQVSLAVQGNTVALQLSTSNLNARRELRESLAALKQSLTEAGLQVTDIEIVAQASQPGAAGEEQGGAEQGFQGSELSFDAAKQRGDSSQIQAVWQGMLAQQLATPLSAA